MQDRKQGYRLSFHLYLGDCVDVASRAKAYKMAQEFDLALVMRSRTSLGAIFADYLPHLEDGQVVIPLKKILNFDKRYQMCFEQSSSSSSSEFFFRGSPCFPEFK